VFCGYLSCEGIIRKRSSTSCDPVKNQHLYQGGDPDFDFDFDFDFEEHGMRVRSPASSATTPFQRCRGTMREDDGAKQG